MCIIFVHHTRIIHPNLIVPLFQSFFFFCYSVTLRGPPSQIYASGSNVRIIRMYIIHTCISIRDHRYMHHASWIHVSGSRIIHICITHTCIKHSCFRVKDQGSLIHASHICASFTYHMHQDPGSQIYTSYKHGSGQGSRIIDKCNTQTCIIHTCIRIKDHRYMHHTYMGQGQVS